MTLDQIGGIPGARPVKARVHHAADSAVDEFHMLARAWLGQPGYLVVVNFPRKAIGQEWDGHISPLAAYDAKADRFFTLDVARCEFPPAWGKTLEIFDAMNAND